jgi:hypothetical protein
LLSFIQGHISSQVNWLLGRLETEQELHPRGKGIRDTRINKLASRGVTRVELGNLLENFKTDTLSTLSSQLDTIKMKKKQDEENAILTIFFSRCRKRHPLKECPLNIVIRCGFCIDNHET